MNKTMYTSISNARYAPRLHLGIDIGTVVHEALDHLVQPYLTGHMQWRGELSPVFPRPGGAVHISTIADEEAGSGCVLQQDGTVEEGQGGAIRAHAPGIGVTAMDNLEVEGLRMMS